MFSAFFIPPTDAHIHRVARFVTMFFSITALNFVIARKIPASSYATGIEQLMLTSYIIASLSAPHAIVIGVLEIHARQAKAEAKVKEKEVKQKLNLAKMMSSPSKMAKQPVAATPSSPTNGGGIAEKGVSDDGDSTIESIPLNFGNDDTNGGGGSGKKGRPARQLNFGEALGKALSVHYEKFAIKPKEQFSFKYNSAMAMVLDRALFWTFLLVDLSFVITFFIKGSVA